MGRDHRKTAGGRVAGQGNRKGNTSVKPLRLVQTNGASTSEWGCMQVHVHSYRVECNSTAASVYFMVLA